MFIAPTYSNIYVNCFVLGYSNLGCYHAEVTNVVIHYLLDGAVPGLRRDAVRKCALVANSEGALVFGVVQLGHCVLSKCYQTRQVYSYTFEAVTVG